MKYLVIADLHGSEYGLANLRRAIALQHPDSLILLGDLVRGGYGGTSDVLIFLRECTLPKIAVLGNTDFPSDADLLGFDLPDRRSLRFGKWVVEMQHIPFYSSLEQGHIYMNGHTHRKTLYEENGIIHLNPGSISLPRDGSPSYAVLEEGKLSLWDAMEDKALSSVSL